jgi:DNA polymerase
MMAFPRETLQRLIASRLESLAAAGVSHLPRAALDSAARTDARGNAAASVASNQGIAAPSSPLRPAAPVASAPVSMESPNSTGLTQTPPRIPSSMEQSPPSLLLPPLAGPRAPVNEIIAELSILRQEVAGCTRCRELASTRTQTVFGVGNPQARLCFLGEAPGADEDLQGEPFVGRAGQLLNRIIDACQLKRQDVYIFNILKCRPPGNRTPAPEEASNCRPYLERQIELIRPEFLCCLGAVAAQNLLGTTTSIGKLRGRFWDYRGIQVVCTYHPAYLLRNPAAKKDAWDDMKFLMRAMGVELDAK